MPPITPDPKSIRAFESAESFEEWLSENHDKAQELYLRLYKKGSTVPSVTYSEALDVALCWGWIDGIRKSWDADSFLQRFTPRRPRSVWSQLNRERVERLIAEGRMTPHGLKQVEAAKADGRWDAAYASGRTMEMPADLLEAIEREPKALESFRTLDKANRYAMAWRLGNLKTAESRQKRIAAFVELLKEGKTLHPTAKAK